MISRLKTAAAAMMLAATALTSSGASAAPLKNSTPAPEFAGIDKWLNSEPLSISQLRGKVVRAPELDRDIGRRVAKIHGLRTVEIVAHGPDAQRIMSRRQSPRGETEVPLLVANNSNGDWRARLLRADQHAFHGSFVRRAYCAG